MSNFGKYKATTGYSSNNINDLNFKKDDMIIVLDRTNDLFWVLFNLITIKIDNSTKCIIIIFVKLKWVIAQNGYIENNPHKTGYFPANLVNMYI